jgi:hypothetical protein
MPDRLVDDLADTGWNRIPVDPVHMDRLWRVFRVMLARYAPPPYELNNIKDELALDAATRPKFYALERIFWVRLSDFMDQVRRYPHLSGISLSKQGIALTPINPAQSDEQKGGQAANRIQHVPGGNLPNGYH